MKAAEAAVKEKEAKDTAIEAYIYADVTEYKSSTAMVWRDMEDSRGQRGVIARTTQPSSSGWKGRVA